MRIASDPAPVPAPVSVRHGRARQGWPRPPAALTAIRLIEPPEGARVTVAGLVILRQRPGTAKGVIFLTLEDETGVVNVVVWRNMYEHFRRAVIAGRLLRITGRLQRAHNVVHVVAEQIEDLSPLLDSLLAPSHQPSAATPHDGVSQSRKTRYKGKNT